MANYLSVRGPTNRERPTWPFRLNAASQQAQGLIGWYPLMPPDVNANLLTGSRPSTIVTHNVSGSPLVGAARLCDGSTSLMTFASDVPSLAAPITIAAWVRILATGTQLAIGAIESSPFSSYMQIDRSSLNVFRAVTRTAGPTFGVATGTTTTTVGLYYHVCGVFRSTTSRSIFVNGRAEATNTTSNNPASLVDVQVGCLNAGTFMNGNVADLRIYNRALTDAEVRSLYDPSTRWDLYETPSRRLYVDLAVTPPAVGNPWYYYRHQRSA